MLDFVDIVKIKDKKSGNYTIKPEFLTCESKDLMSRGKGFYAFWDEETGLWCTNEYELRKAIDRAIFEEKEKLEKKFQGEDIEIKTLLLKNYSSKKWSEWQSYVKSLPDNFHSLDEKITFSNTPVKKEDYITRKLPYPLVEGECPNYDELMDTLYDPDEREKLEWAIGAIISGDSKKIQKFLVLYGEPGSGKSTVLNIIQQLFEGYFSVFEAKNLTSTNASFALESFKMNPLIAIQHDGDLSRIEDNTKLNSIVSHEYMEIDEKFKSKYKIKLNSFLFMGTNKPVKITDARSGIIRRLIDVKPSGRRLSKKRYDSCMEGITYELGAIANKCLSLYLSLGESYYDDYRPISMVSKTNDFFNFMEESYFSFQQMDEEFGGVSLKTIWEKYNEYCNEAKVPYPFQMRIVKEEAKTYFSLYFDRKNGVRSWYQGFKTEIFEQKGGSNGDEEAKSAGEDASWLEFSPQESQFDAIFADCPAQYADDEEKPLRKWANVDTKLSDLDTSKLHYVYLPPEMKKYIFLDFDLRDENGEKSLELNKKAASKFPITYAEVSKGGSGIHLHYIYEGDTSKLERIFEEGVEIKVCNGNSSIRRRLTACNNQEIATLYSGLPQKKGDKRMIEEKLFYSEAALRSTIYRCLRKEVHPDTRSCIDFINKVLSDAYESGEPYDVRDLEQKVLIFATNSTHQAEYCVKKVSEMKFMSKSYEEKAILGSEWEEDGGYLDLKVDGGGDDKPITIFDVEVFSNLFIMCYKYLGTENVVRMINPSPDEVRNVVVNSRLVGFNNRKYDNHILYARMNGGSNEYLFNLSQRIVDGDRDAFYSGAYNLSYTDIYDYSSDKKSLKKWEIDLGIHHQELAFPWDEPVDKDKWELVCDYCCNDVIATEAVWNATKDDWQARLMLSEISGLSPNATNNNHSEAIIFGSDKNPQKEFVYTDLSQEFSGYEFNPYGIDKERYPKNEKGKPICTTAKSIFMGEDPSEGGYAWAKKGMYGGVVAFDVASMHPSSIIWLNLFGDKYTPIFKELVDLRKAIKHKEFEKAKEMFGGKLAKYLDDPTQAKKLSNALKIVINSVYGLTAAHFPNRFRDDRNVDNIVAKRGALFMIWLKHTVQNMGYTVVHCKTDCIKVADADEKITQTIFELGKAYGYEFEIEHRFDKFCVVNKAAYIGREIDADGNLGGWIAVADEFKEPYVFKSLFTKEPLDFGDLCQTKSVKSKIFLDMNEGLPEGEHNYIFVGRVGSFCPVEAGAGGGTMLRDQNGEMYAVTGTSGYRWLEAEVVRNWDNPMKIINMDYYHKLADDAISDIEEWGDFTWFTSDEKYNGEVLVTMDNTKAVEEMQEDIMKGYMNEPVGDIPELPFG